MDIVRMIRIAALVARFRPFFRCPFCKGAGGEMSGYYEPEWMECCCYPHWERLNDYDLEWPVGRLPLLQWIRAHASVKVGFGDGRHILRLTDIARCKIGWHRWVKVGDDPRLCCVCCEMRDEEIEEAMLLTDILAKSVPASPRDDEIDEAIAAAILKKALPADLPPPSERVRDLLEREAQP